MDLFSLNSSGSLLGISVFREVPNINYYNILNIFQKLLKQVKCLNIFKVRLTILGRYPLKG